MTDSIVRLAQPEDEAGIMDLCRILHGENGLFPMDDEIVAEVVHSAATGSETDRVRRPPIIGVIGVAGALEGAICMILSEMWYSRQSHLEELFNFVHPDHRRSTHAKRLVEFAKTCADQVGVPLLTGIISNERTEAKCRLYSRMLPKVGEFFLYGAE